MKTKKLIFVLIQAVVIVGLIVGIYFMIQSSIKPTVCYTYAANLKSGISPSTEDFVEVQVPKDGINENMITDLSVLNKMVLNTEVIAGHYAYTNDFINEEDADTFDTADTTELRKYTLSVSRDSAVGGDIASGDYVDLMFTGTLDASALSGDGSDTGQGSLHYSKIFMQRVRVYKVLTGDGKEYINSVNNVQYDADGNATASEPPAYVVLAVTDKELEEITARKLVGDVNIVGLFEDTTESTSDGFTISDTDVRTEYADPENNIGGTGENITSQVDSANMSNAASTSPEPSTEPKPNK